MRTPAKLGLGVIHFLISILMVKSEGRNVRKQVYCMAVEDQLDMSEVFSFDKIMYSVLITFIS